MRRIGISGFVFVMAVVLTGCPTPPPGYQAPTVDSVQVSPEPAHPGDTLTVVIDARDDQAVVGIGPRYLITPDNALLPAPGACQTDLVRPEGTQTHAVATITCPVPTFASNGTWQLEYHVYDGASGPECCDYPGKIGRVAFAVVGGSDDHLPPKLLSYQIVPTTVTQATPFTLTMRLRDESLPISIDPNGSSSIFFTKLFAPQSTFRCGTPTVTPVTSTDIDVVVVCNPFVYETPGLSESGLHRAFPPVSDALGHKTNIEMFVDVQATAGA